MLLQSCSWRARRLQKPPKKPEQDFTAACTFAQFAAHTADHVLMKRCDPSSAFHHHCCLWSSANSARYQHCLAGPRSVCNRSRLMVEGVFCRALLHLGGRRNTSCPEAAIRLGYRVHSPARFDFHGWDPSSGAPPPILIRKMKVASTVSALVHNTNWAVAAMASFRHQFAMPAGFCF